MPSIELLLSDPLLMGLLMLAATLVGLSKGGLPAIGMLSVPILSLYLSPLIAAVLLLPIYILSDIVSVWLYRREFSLENVRILIPAGILGVLIGWATASMVSDQIVSLLIGVMGISFCLYIWSKEIRSHKSGGNQNTDRTEKTVNIPKGLFWGTLSGFTSFVSHAGAPPFQIFILPQRLPKMVFAGTSTIVFAAVNLAKVIPYSMIHPYSSSTLQISAFLLPFAAVGTFLGKNLIQRLSEKRFFLAVQIALFLISIKLVLSFFE